MRPSYIIRELANELRASPLHYVGFSLAGFCMCGLVVLFTA